MTRLSVFRLLFSLLARMPRVLFYFTFLRNALAQSAAKFAMVANVNGPAGPKTDNRWEFLDYNRSWVFGGSSGEIWSKMRLSFKRVCRMRLN